jgi:ABC-2 type transport system permease protein
MTALTGTGELVRIALRRDRLLLPACVLGIAGPVLSTASGFQRLYPDAARRSALAETLAGDPTFTVLFGPPRALETIGGLTSWRIGTTMAVLVGLVSLLLVGRHTRADEEHGRGELVGAAPVGSRAPLAAALMVVGLTNLAVATLVGLGLIGLGLPPGGSVVLGASLAATGLVFGGVGAVTAQAAERARAAFGLAGAMLAAALTVAVAGNAGDGGLAWLSPIGWAKAAQPFAGSRVWPLLLSLAAAAALTLGAFALLARRDHGTGLIPARSGPSRAGRRLDSPLALAARELRGGLLGWTAGLFAAGAAFGALGGSSSEIIRSSSGVGDLLARSGGTNPTDAYFASTASILGLVAAGFAVSSSLRLRAEEASGRLESLLAAPVGRVRWAAGLAGLAMAGAFAVTLAAGLGMGVVHALSSHDAAELPRLAGALLVQVPAIWLVGSVGVALFGLAPRLAPAAWVGLAACVLLWLVGPLLDLPAAVRDLSPFEHVPALPVASLATGPLLATAAVAFALCAVGLAGFARRDHG